jgi:2'-5' RNA ligase
VTGAVRRAFVAARPPDDILDIIDRAVTRARRAMVGPRWATRDQWHVTLQFLGAVDDVDAVSAALAAVASEAPFHASLSGAGGFPSAHRARIVWVGAGGSGEWLPLVTAVGSVLAPLGYEVETRPFRPHVTVARLREPAPVLAAVDGLLAGLELAGLESGGGSWMVDEVVLLESALAPSGARYTPLTRISLQGA